MNVRVSMSFTVHVYTHMISRYLCVHTNDMHIFITTHAYIHTYICVYILVYVFMIGCVLVYVFMIGCVDMCIDL